VTLPTEESKQLEVILGKLHSIEKQVTSINGHVRRHEEEIFGDDKKKTVGLRPEMDTVHDLIVGLKAVLWVLGSVVSIDAIAHIVDALRG